MVTFPAEERDCPLVGTSTKLYCLVTETVWNYLPLDITDNLNSLHLKPTATLSLYF